MPEKMTAEDVTAKLRGLLEILGALHKAFPKGSPQDHCDMLRGSVATLDQLAGVWPDAEDEQLVQHAGEVQQSAAAADLLCKVLTGEKPEGKRYGGLA